VQLWRTSTPDAETLDDRELIDRHRHSLASGEGLSDQKAFLILTLPVRARFRGGRAALLSPPGANPHVSRPDPALIRAVARAHRWKQMLIDGEMESLETLATRVRQERRHVCRTLSLAFLSPELTRTILDGKQPAGVRLAHLLKAHIPLSWRDQRAMFKRMANGSAAWRCTVPHDWCAAAAAHDSESLTPAVLISRKNGPKYVLAFPVIAQPLPCYRIYASLLFACFEKAATPANPL
jgi:hypothetical protein